MKSLESCGTRLMGLNFYIVMHRKMLQKCSSQELLLESTPNMAQMFLMRSRLSVVTVYVDLKSKMAALASD